MTKTYIKPDRAMAYAGIISQLRSRNLGEGTRERLTRRAKEIRDTLTAYEIGQAHKLLGIA